MKKGKINSKDTLEKEKHIKYSTTKKKRNMKKEEEKIRLIRIKKKVWRYVNKYRKKKKRIDRI